MKKNSDLGKLLQETIENLEVEKRTKEAIEEHQQAMADERRAFLTRKITNLLAEKRAELAKAMAGRAVAEKVNEHSLKIPVETKGIMVMTMSSKSPKGFALGKFGEIYIAILEERTINPTESEWNNMTLLFEGKLTAKNAALGLVKLDDDSILGRRFIRAENIADEEIYTFLHGLTAETIVKRIADTIVNGVDLEK